MLLTGSVCTPNEVGHKFWAVHRSKVGRWHCDESTLFHEFSVKGIKMQAIKFCLRWWMQQMWFSRARSDCLILFFWKFQMKSTELGTQVEVWALALLSLNEICWTNDMNLVISKAQVIITALPDMNVEMLKWNDTPPCKPYTPGRKQVLYIRHLLWTRESPHFGGWQCDIYYIWQHSKLYESAPWLPASPLTFNPVVSLSFFIPQRKPCHSPDSSRFKISFLRIGAETGSRCRDGWILPEWAELSGVGQMKGSVWKGRRNPDFELWHLVFFLSLESGSQCLSGFFFYSALF